MHLRQRTEKKEKNAVITHLFLQNTRGLWVGVVKRVDDEIGRKEQEGKPVRMEKLMPGCVKLSVHRGKVAALYNNTS